VPEAAVVVIFKSISFQLDTPLAFTPILWHTPAVVSEPEQVKLVALLLPFTQVVPERVYPPSMVSPAVRVMIPPSGYAPFNILIWETPSAEALESAPFAPVKSRQGLEGPPQVAVLVPVGDTYTNEQEGSLTVVTQVTVAGLGHP
jgi:hypothetical protein